jgi:nucleotide-binding universal stress UspA family protein
MAGMAGDGGGTGRPVVVGADGSDSALRAVRWAAHTAASRGRDLHVVHAYGGVDPSLVADASLWRRYQQDLLDHAREIAARAVAVAHDAAPSVTVTEELVDGAAAPALLERADDALLVVGEQGVGGLGGTLVGSVASSVAAHAVAPVVVVRGDEPTEPAAPVVVGVDGSPVSDAAIDFAVVAADLAGCPLVAVHTWWDPLFDPVTEPLLGWDAIVDDERRVLAEQLAGRSAAYPDLAVSTVVEHSHPSRALLERARGARLLVVGSRGRGGFTGLLLGSVGRAMVHRAPCPVAVVPPPGGGPGRRAEARVEVAAR